MGHTIRSIIYVGSFLAFVACSKDTSKPNYEPIQDMLVQPNLKAQKYDEFFKGGISSLVPPDHTVPVGFKPYLYASDPDKAAQMKNPFAGNSTEAVLSLGKNMYENNCMVCHGAKGLADGAVAKKYPLPVPQLVTEKIKGWSDGRIYHVISVGQGTMGSYAGQVPQNARWQLVNYIRQLQKM
jgi:mono/diheme cytochrome c family protein